MSETRELRRCPFCGSSGTADTDIHTDVCGEFEVICEQCGTAATTVEFWNARPIEDDLRAEVERLKALLRQAAGVVIEDDYYSQGSRRGLHDDIVEVIGND